VGRSYDESCRLLDSIVGRCVRDAAFGDAVIADPEAALAAYRLEEHELDDFRALSTRHSDEARAAWSSIRAALPPGWPPAAQP
jgi:hypothetical protein